MPLPDGWTEHMSNTYKKPYFLHTSGRRTWTRPSTQDEDDRNTITKFKRPPDNAFITFLLKALQREALSDTDWFEESPSLPILRIETAFMTQDDAIRAMDELSSSLVKDRAALLVPDAALWRLSDRGTWGHFKLQRRAQSQKYGDRSIVAYDEEPCPMYWIHHHALIERLPNHLEIAAHFNLSTFAAWIGIDTQKVDPFRQLAARTTYAERESADKVEWAEASFFRVFLIRKKHTLAASSFASKIQSFACES